MEKPALSPRLESPSLSSPAENNPHQPESDLRPRRRCVVLIALLLNAGCSNTEPVDVGHSPTNQAPSLPADTPESAAADDKLAEIRQLQSDLQKPPYQLNLDTIVHLVYLKSYRVRAAREEMLAAQHGLTEFRANLNRFEPFLEARTSYADFPNRRGARGTVSEAVVGLQKETFEGAVLRTEAGASHSRFRFDDADVTEDDLEEGSGVLVRARIEVPFSGSRRKQERIIAQAFQESTARKAQLDYLENYRSFVVSATSAYTLTVYYKRLALAYSRFVDTLDGLLNDRRVRPEDRGRVQSVRADADAQAERYLSREREYLTTLLAEIGVRPEEEHELVVPPHRLSPVAVQATTSEGLEQLIDEARSNNPTFAVLDDAIADAELQRDQARDGRYDISAFLEGTQFPLGSESFDDRLDGWSVAGGLSFRLNDRRVLTATRNKAEAQIRQFRAQMEAENMDMRREIVAETSALLDNEQNRNTLLSVIEQKAAEFSQRLRDYFDAKVTIDQVLDTRSELVEAESNLASNYYNSGNREARLLGATGRIYDIVGLDIEREVAYVE